MCLSIRYNSVTVSYGAEVLNNLITKRLFDQICDQTVTGLPYTTHASVLNTHADIQASRFEVFKS